MISKLIPLVAATALFSTAALADEHKAGEKSMQSADATFKALDRNADERLSQTEVASDAEVSSQFASLDTDSDGYLSKREYAAHSKSQKSKDY